MSNAVHIPFGKPNPLQQRVITEFKVGKRILLMVSGRQGGKSHLGARWLLSHTADNDAKNKLAMVVAPNYTVAITARRKLDEILKADARLWDRIKFREQPIPTYTLPNGWIIEVRSTDNPDSLRGPTAAVIWHDEAAGSAEAAFDILMPTLLAEDGLYLATTTPKGKTSWIYRRIAKKAYPPGHPEHDPELYNPIYAVVAGSTWDNVDNLSEAAVSALEDQYGKTSAFGRQEIYGEFVSFEGLVYQWNEERNYVSVTDLPEDFDLVVGGIDFGWTDPTCAVVLGYKAGNWYALDGIYQENLLREDLQAHVLAMTDRYGVQVWWGDSAAAESIAAMSKAGIRILPVTKPLIEERIRELAMFADHNRFKVSYRCPWLKDEFQMYQYPPEERLLRDKRRNPLDRNNHAMDAIGYAVWESQYLWNNARSVRVRHRKEGKDPDTFTTLIKERKQRGRDYRSPSGLVGQ